MKVLVQNHRVPLIQSLLHFVRDSVDYESGEFLPAVGDVVGCSSPLGKAVSLFATIKSPETFEKVFHLLMIMLSPSFSLDLFKVPPNQNLIKERVSLAQSRDFTVYSYYTHRSQTISVPQIEIFELPLSSILDAHFPETQNTPNLTIVIF